MTQRPHWSVPKITAFCKTCKNVPELIDFNIKIEGKLSLHTNSDHRHSSHRCVSEFLEKWHADSRTFLKALYRFIDMDNHRWTSSSHCTQFCVLWFRIDSKVSIHQIILPFTIASSQNIHSILSHWVNRQTNANRNVCHWNIPNHSDIIFIKWCSAYSFEQSATRNIQSYFFHLYTFMHHASNLAFSAKTDMDGILEWYFEYQIL